MDQTADGKRLKNLPVVDEFTRRCLTIELERSMTAEDMVLPLKKLFERHDDPEHIRSDNGPEFIAKAFRRWLSRRGLRALYIASGSLWENVSSGSFNSRFRDSSR